MLLGTGQLLSIDPAKSGLNALVLSQSPVKLDDTGVNKDTPKLAVTDVNVPDSTGYATFNVTLDKASGLVTTVLLISTRPG